MGAAGPIETDEADQAGKRREKRARVLLTARIKTASGEEDVRLRDLSRKGALIECDAPPPMGSEVVFFRGTTVVPARVAWRAGRRAGLEFLEMIDESEVLSHTVRAAPRPEARPQALPQIVASSYKQDFRRPRITGQSLSTQERKLAEMWGVQVGITISDD